MDWSGDGRSGATGGCGLCPIIAFQASVLHAFGDVLGAPAEPHERAPIYAAFTVSFTPTLSCST